MIFSHFLLQSWGDEGDVGCKSCVLAIASVGVHAVRSLFEGEVAENARFPDRLSVALLGVTKYPLSGIAAADRL